MKRYTSNVYLIHFETPLCHARHYLGATDDVNARLARHRKGLGANILRVCNENNISYKVARVWENKPIGYERKLKNRKNAPILCPICNPDKFDLNGIE
jgi:predicted GIY-YIG superfamily endonuclease